MFDTFFTILIEYAPVFLEGALITLLYATITVVCGSIIGGLLSIIKLSNNKIINCIINGYVSIIRGTPLLVQLYIFYYGIPLVTGIDIMKEASIAIALIINSSAYITEIIRSGIQAVDKGQTEAARSLGMSNINTMKKIILPQAIKNILPALGNEFISVVKETSLAAILFGGDLMTSFTTVKSITFKTLEPLFIIGIIYFILNYILSKLVNRLERKMALSD